MKPPFSLSFQSENQEENENEGQKTWARVHIMAITVFTYPALKKSVLNANIIKWLLLNPLCQGCTMPTNLHSLLKDEISPISTDDEFSRTGKSSLDNSTTMKTSVNLAAFEGFFSFI